MTILPDKIKNVEITTIRDPFLFSRKISLGMLRLDKIHPVISGNKIFKLKYFMQKAKEKGVSSIATLGGPFSNHLHATAFAAKQIEMKSIGLVRGEISRFNETLKECQKNGMELIFLKREEYDQMNEKKLHSLYPEAMIIPQGGYGHYGAYGASEIMNLPGVSDFNIILAACGTGTTGAGLILGSSPEQEIILISVLKNNYSIKDEIQSLLPAATNQSKFKIESRFHLGGYAKKNKELFQTMNNFYSNFKIPTDFVYTGKMIYAFEKLVAEDYFQEGSRILLIHTGGLQGNRSLMQNELTFKHVDYL